MRIWIYSGLMMIIMVGCQPNQVNFAPTNQEELPKDFPENLWISQQFQAKVDSIFKFHDQARKYLQDQDTLGAEIYFNEAYEVVSGLNDQDRLTLQYWSQFDSVFKYMTDEYERIYFRKNVAIEAEEVREELADFEEFYFADSLLQSDVTVIDSSGGIPITLNRKVRLAIQYFQTRGRAVFTRWLERSGKYEELVRNIYKEEKLPEELIYLGMIESGFNPHARSYARAVGMWQFIAATGKYYGLRNSWWFDERRDVVKSTRASARHLKDLYDRFGDWYLALAGYNCNPKKVEYNMRRYKTRDFWKLKRLPRQTRNYVPTFLAATIIAKNPRQFGFYVEKEKPIEFDQVQISESLDLNVIAKLVDTTYQYIKELNPAVVRWITPPGVKNFNVYLPKGSKEKFLQRYQNIADSEKRSWVRHKIRGGETLSTIAYKYKTSMSVIKSVNHIRGSRIREGKYLLIPVPQNKAQYYAYNNMRYVSSKKKYTKKLRVTNVPGHKKEIYIVRKGDTIGQIAEDFNTRASKIRAWNGLRYGEYIYPKQKLVIWVPENLREMKKKADRAITLNDDKHLYYTVKKGDTLWDISQKYNLSVRDLKNLNNMRNTAIRPGDRLKIAKQE